jgi:hypothetical protein
MHMPAFPAAFLKHPCDKIAVRGKNLPAHGTDAGVFVVCGIAEGAAEDMADPLGDISRFYAALKHEAFYQPAFFQKAAADRTGFQGGISAIAAACAVCPGPPFFVFAVSPARRCAPRSGKKRTARH